MISKEEVQHIANLARLGLNPAEIKKNQKELSAILDYVKKLKKVNVLSTKPTSHPFFVQNVLRPDEPRSKPQNQNLVSSSPDSKDGYVKVKTILK